MFAVSTMSGALARLVTQFVDSAQELRTRARNRKVLAQLASLDDRMLRDIGISRLDVASAWDRCRNEDPIAMLRGRAGRR